jgi:DNA-binding PadR family transcriptional regulator
MRKLKTVLLAGAVDTRFYSWDLRQAAHLHNARLYELLVLFKQRGWLTDGWDEPEPGDDQPQHWYVLTDLGRRELARP